MLGLGLATPAIAGNHVFSELSLPLLAMVAGGAATVCTALRTRVARRLGARLAARRRELALVERLARLCRLGDFPRRQERVCALVGFLAAKADLSRRQQKLLATASTLHRIGLVSLPPCPAADHHQVARRAVAIAERLLSGRTALHRAAGAMARAHEESWDGGGQPFRLSGQDIPFPARLLQVALALDALLPRTGYVPDWTTLEAIAARIGAEGGRTLDPELALLPLRNLGELVHLLESHLIQPGACAPAQAGGFWGLATSRAAGAMLATA